ncbi:hypothetical protein RIF29_33800 [Crotalaria pallida]|uniref:Uncharacterized protein n=1 Tax=Crotalaria pallida TaxID=3830 RepID=A0AAN9E8I4_CROPI
MTIMNSILKIQSLLIIYILLNSLFMVSEARPLSIIETGNSATRGEVADFIDWLSLGAIKQSGPSPGVGHKYTNTDTLGLGGIKNSGPSSGGEGHKFTNSETLGEIKDSGPSPGREELYSFTTVTAASSATGTIAGNGTPSSGLASDESKQREEGRAMPRQEPPRVSLRMPSPDLPSEITFDDDKNGVEEENPTHRRVPPRKPPRELSWPSPEIDVGKREGRDSLTNSGMCHNNCTKVYMLILDSFVWHGPHTVLRFFAST